MTPISEQTGAITLDPAPEHGEPLAGGASQPPREPPGPPGPPEGPPDIGVSEAIAHTMGAWARRNGQSSDHCAWAAGTPKGEAWRRGWFEEDTKAKEGRKHP